MRKLMLIPAAVLAVVALSGCAGKENVKVIEISMNGKTVQCVEWTWIEAGSDSVEEVALDCDFTGATR